MSKKFIVITSIFPPTTAIRKFSNFKDWKIIVVGDKKSPDVWDFPNVEYLSVASQSRMNSAFVNTIPWNSYTRKNIGYFYAISQGADLIYDTDDDNIPLSNWISDPAFSIGGETITQPPFVNIYKFFTDEHVWPRGLPLQHILNNNLAIESTMQSANIGVWQFLADEDPDVDAIYRLTNNTPIYFKKRQPVILDAGVCCPFNSQNTYFSKAAFPLLYLPSTVTFRFTDILRGLVAQPILWAARLRLAFGEATVIQKRNPHNYLNDFESEIPCYLLSETVTSIAIKNVSSDMTISENLLSVYYALLAENIVKQDEIEILKLWLSKCTDSK